MKKAHHQLEAWRLSMELAEDIYRITTGFPSHERYGMVAQMRRAVISIPSNVAEGAARLYQKEFRRFLCTARGSLMELETQLMLAERLEYTANTDHLHSKINRVFGLINGLIRKHSGQSMNTGYKGSVRETRIKTYPLPSTVSPSRQLEECQ